MTRLAESPPLPHRVSRTLFKEREEEPRLLWLRGLSAGLRAKGFDSQSGHRPGSSARFPVGGVPEATTH